MSREVLTREEGIAICKRSLISCLTVLVQDAERRGRDTVDVAMMVYMMNGIVNDESFDTEVFDLALDELNK